LAWAQGNGGRVQVKLRAAKAQNPKLKDQGKSEAQSSKLSPVRWRSYAAFALGL
jgi:hypothetical protein